MRIFLSQQSAGTLILKEYRNQTELGYIHDRSFPLFRFIWYLKDMMNENVYL